MTSTLNRLRVRLAPVWRLHPPLVTTTLIMLVALAACSLGLALDARTILGAPAWLKPAKFAASISVYCVSLLWLFSYIPARVRVRRIVGWVTAAVMLLEMAIISLQSARGTTSHFNVSSPENALLWVVMGSGIVIQTLSTLAVAIASFRQEFADPALGWALRLGLAVTIAGALLGGLMTRPTAEQLSDMRAGQVLVSGAHTVGAPDGGPGLPITGWSREHGDLRVAHFMGLHALQVLPLFALALRRTRASTAQRTRLVLGLAASYVGLVALVLWQALRGQSLLAPDATTLGALLGWLALTGGAGWRALAERAPARSAAIGAS